MDKVPEAHDVLSKDLQVLDVSWKARYRELEQTLEVILQSVSDVFEQLEKPPVVRDFCIRTVTTTKRSENSIRIICVADGSNLEYRFSPEKNGKALGRPAFQRSNSFTVQSKDLQDWDAVTVAVRSNIPEFNGKVLSRKVALNG